MRPIPAAVTIPVTEDLFHSSAAVIAYWWDPPDNFRSSLNGFVGMLPPPALYAERLAHSLRRWTAE